MPRKRVLARIILVAAIIFAVVMALTPRPPMILHDIYDKWQHMAAFGVLAALATFSFPTTSVWLVGERLSFLGALIEVAQASPLVGRDCDIMDWAADTLAIALVLLAISWWRRVRRRRAAT